MALEIASMALLQSLTRQASPEQHQQNNNINPLSDCSVSDLALMSCMYASSSFVQIHSCVKQMSASWTWIAVARKQGFLIKWEVYWQCKKDVHISLSLSLSLILPNPSTLHKSLEVSWGLHKCYIWWLHQPETIRAHYWDWAMYIFYAWDVTVPEN